MKRLSAFLFSLLATPAFAASLVDGKIDDSQKNILLRVIYSGGCGQHTFSLKMGECLKDYQVQCLAELVDDSRDVCDVEMSETLTIPISQYGLDSDYFKGAALTIIGDKDWETNSLTQVSLTLPK